MKRESTLIRPGNKEDLKIVAKIIKKVWGIGGDYLMEQKYGIIGFKPWQKWVSDDILNYIREEMDHFLVCEHQSRVVGFICYQLDRERQIGTVGYNAVDPAYQGKGFGELLVKKVLAVFEKESMSYAKVVTLLNKGHAPARKMYEKTGFEPLVKNVAYVMKL